LIFETVRGRIVFMQSAAITSIVDTYVRYGDRRGLDNARAHRARLIADLKALEGPFDSTRLITQLEDEVAVIETGLARFRPAAAA
jgi:hypothetical protein